MSNQQDAAFMRIFMVVLGALVAFTIVIVVIANLLGESEGLLTGDPMLKQAVGERIGPVGEVAVTGAAIEAEAASAQPAAAASEPASGKDVVQSACVACHATGAAGAPKIGDKAAWEPRVAQGMAVLVEHAIKGFKGMPPKGGHMTLSDEAVKAAVVSMLEDTGVAVPDAAAGAAAAPAAAEPSASVSGKDVYTRSCFACHGTGAAGAPKLGDKAAWQPRIGKGDAVLLTSALNGLNAMPPKGGNPALTDQEVEAAVTYMLSESR